ncbi:hypothetical protein LTR94_038601, partial [Friedmanniomyces endolithicus]
HPPAAECRPVDILCRQAGRQRPRQDCAEGRRGSGRDGDRRHGRRSRRNRRRKRRPHLSPDDVAGRHG